MKATSEKRTSLSALKDQDKIFLTIKTDPIMRQRWDRYCKDNYYANGIDFDEVLGVLNDIIN